MFVGLPLVALAGALTAGLYVPLAGLAPTFGFPGDLIVVLYLLSLLTLGIGLAGANSLDRFSLIGATRTLTQVFSYEAPFLLALLGPAMVAGSWQIGKITAYAASHWLILTQPLGFLVALIGLMGNSNCRPSTPRSLHRDCIRCDDRIQWARPGNLQPRPGGGTGGRTDAGFCLLPGRPFQPTLVPGQDLVLLLAWWASSPC